MGAEKEAGKQMLENVAVSRGHLGRQSRALLLRQGRKPCHGGVKKSIIGLHLEFIVVFQLPKTIAY